MVESLQAIAQGPARKTMGLLALGVGLVFLVGCVNLAILMGAEGRRRQGEVAIRIALGAGVLRLWREVAAEKCQLTLLSLGFGLAFAPALLRVLVWLVPAAGLGPPLPYLPPLNLAVLLGFSGFAVLATLVWSGLLVGAANGKASSSTLARGSGGYTGIGDAGPVAGRWRQALLAAQAGLGVCLLSAAALTVGAYATRSTASLGQAPRRTLLLSVNPRDSVILTDAQAADFNRQVLSQLERLPGARAIALVDVFPPGGVPVTFRERGDSADRTREASLPTSVSPGYFSTLGIPILVGRGFDQTDSDRSEPVAIISVDMAERNWPSPELAVGSQIIFGTKLLKSYKVVGVAASFTGYWNQEPVPTVYVPLTQSGNPCGAVVLRTTGSASAAAALIPRLLAGMPVPATVSDLSTMQARWQATLTRPLARVAGMVLLAILGMGMSIQGVYASAAGTVAARRHDLAVRSALGVPPEGLAWTVTRESVLAVLLGALLGAAAAVELGPVLEQWLGPIGLRLAEAIAVAVVLMGLAATAGCYIPARAAMRADPAELLRQG